MMKIISISDEVSHHMRYAVADLLDENPEAIIIYSETQSKTMRKIQFNELGLALFINVYGTKACDANCVKRIAVEFGFDGIDHG